MARLVMTRHNAGRTVAGPVDLIVEQDADGTYRVYTILNLEDGREIKREAHSTNDQWEAESFVSVYSIS
ncbi:hypothetical protein MYO4S_00093 [Serratia phage 4S]|nr:hypothetical protein MYO4S_00093 [Serratia phage 4S]